MMVGTNLTEVQLQQIVDKTVVQLDKNQDGLISYEEFCDIIAKVDEDIFSMILIYLTFIARVTMLILMRM